MNSFYEYLEEEHKTDPHKKKLHNVLLVNLKKKFKLFENLNNYVYEDCSICFQLVNKISLQKTKCGHIFHSHCINRWLKLNTRKSCPLCRNDLNEPSSASFKWYIKKQNNHIPDFIPNTHINFDHTLDDLGNEIYSLKLIVTGDMGSSGDAEYII
jgi:hypothetical protein